MKIGILGASGRMGRLLIGEVLANKGLCSLGGVADIKGHPDIGKDAGTLVHLPPCGICVTEDARAVFRDSNVVIDFTLPDATATHAALAHEFGKPLVVGTTGLNNIEIASLETAAKKTAIVYSANYSLGVNLLTALVEMAAAKLSAAYDIEIFEAHHRHKKDAPSGTAYMLGKAAARGRGIDLEAMMVPARFGPVGERVPGSIGFSVFRGGDVVGEHTVTLAGPGERIELAHKATDRTIFAKGALKAALWVVDKKPGLYSMRDVLDISGH